MRVQVIITAGWFQVVNMLAEQPGSVRACPCRGCPLRNLRKPVGQCSGVTGTYGGVHLIPWYGQFATQVERILCRISGLLIEGGAAVLGIDIISLQHWGTCDASDGEGHEKCHWTRWHCHWTRWHCHWTGRHCHWTGRHHRYACPIAVGEVYLLYPGVRFYIVVEAFGVLSDNQLDSTISKTCSGSTRGMLPWEG